MVSQVQAARKAGQSIEISLSEFGQLNLRHFDLTRTYRGWMMRLDSATMKSISDATGFTACFEHPGVRSAFIDVYRGEAHFTLEIERNTKPQDVSVRYTRERWSLQDVLGKQSDGVRTSIRTDYHARSMPEQSLISLATLLGIPADQINNFYLRINFKDHSCGLIGEELSESYVPDGTFNTFILAAPNTVASESDEELGFKENTQMANQENTWIVDRAAGNDGDASGAEGQVQPTADGHVQTAGADGQVQPAGADGQVQAASADGQVQPGDVPSPAQRATAETTSGQTPVVQSEEAKQAAATDLADQIKATEEAINSAAAAVAQAAQTKPSQEIAPTRDGTYVSSPPAVKPIVIPSRNAADSRTGSDARNSADTRISTDSRSAVDVTARPDRPAGGYKPDAQMANDKPADRSSDRNSDRNRNDRERPSDRVLDRSNSNAGSSTVRRDNAEVQPKYATYSKSEVDYMLKQQAESILSALSGKIAQQQRTFQETIAAQEKSFSKLYDNFVTQFESSKTKLETTSKVAHENTSGELENFKKTLSKELEQHRTLINKTVLPVQKALEDRPLKAPKEQAKQPAQTVVVKGTSPHNSKLILATLAAVALSLFISIANLLTLGEINKQVADLTKAAQPAHK